MKKKEAFTLIELLVVIAIIALLLAVLMPALKKAKLIAKAIVCVANCKTLSTAWNVYATDNHGKIVSSKTGFGGYGQHLTDPLNSNPNQWTHNAWVDWAGYPNYNDPADKERQIQAVERGALFPYVQTIKAYHCPASQKDQVRCFVIPDIVGYAIDFWTKHESLGDRKVILKTTDIKTTSDQIIFLDEDDVSFAGFTIWYNQASWWDRPPARHNDGITLGYADGHAGYYKWRDQRTSDLASKKISNFDQLGNEDMINLQRGVFGTLGYVPEPAP